MSFFSRMRMRRTWLLSTALLACLQNGAVTAQVVASQPALPPGVQVVVSGHDLPADAYSLLVQEVGNASPLLAVNTDVAMNPASTMKTLTTLAALELLGPDYTWETAIYALGPVVDGTLQGDLLIRGGGDPFLVEEYFRSMLKALHRRGVERVTGDLIIDASYFDSSVNQQTAIDNQGSRSYNVLPHALATNFQTVNFYFYPHSNGRDVVIKADPDLPNLAITNNLRLRDVPCSGFQRGVSFAVDPGNSSGVIFSGQYPARCSEYVLPRAVLDAPNYTYGMFRQLWQELGGVFTGSLRFGTAPPDQQPIVVWLSPPLSDVIKSINKFSNNMMTRQVLLTLGAERTGTPATVASGIQTVHEYLDGIGIGHDSLVIVNGAGLSHDARLTSSMLGGVLQHAYSLSTMPEFIASLPLTGLDGTMRDRLRGSGASGNQHIKTGSLDGVAAIAGYVHASSGRQYVVVGMLNHELADRGPGVELMDALLAWVYLQ